MDKLDVYHIRYQCEADENGVIDGTFDKNAMFNLVALCKNDHMAVHRGEYIIDGWMEGSQGRYLSYRKCDGEAIEIEDKCEALPKVPKVESPKEKTKVKPKVNQFIEIEEKCDALPKVEPPKVESPKVESRKVKPKRLKQSSLKLFLKNKP